MLGAHAQQRTFPTVQYEPGEKSRRQLIVDVAAGLRLGKAPP
jgi:hypothetical protein